MTVNQFLIGLLLVFLCTTLTAQSKWQFSSAGTAGWQSLPVGSGWDYSDYRFHDFDGDGKTDVFTVKNGQWLFSSAGATTWKTLNAAFADQNIRAKNLRFGDFNGDGKMDVFLEQKGYWGYVSGGKGRFIQLRKAETTIDKIGFGDFNGDGKTDLFKHK